MEIKRLLEIIKVDNRCWNKKGCIFNSNNSQRYMKCLQEQYSIEKCLEDNIQNYCLYRKNN